MKREIRVNLRRRRGALRRVPPTHSRGASPDPDCSATGVRRRSYPRRPLRSPPPPSPACTRSCPSAARRRRRDMAICVEHGAVIVTKDEDFPERSPRSPCPPSVVWLRIGNCSNSALSAWFRASACLKTRAHFAQHDHRNKNALRQLHFVHGVSLAAQEIGQPVRIESEPHCHISALIETHLPIMSAPPAWRQMWKLCRFHLPIFSHTPFTPKKPWQMPHAVDDVEHADGIPGDPVKHEVVAKAGYRQHSHVAQAWVSRRKKETAFRLAGEQGQRRVHRIEHAFRRRSIISRDKRVDRWQIIFDDCPVPLDPHSARNLVADWRTRSFQSSSSGSTGRSRFLPMRPLRSPTPPRSGDKPLSIPPPQPECARRASHPNHREG